MDGRWFYSADGKERTGPVAQDEIERRLSRGELAPSTLVWTDGMAQWQPATEVSALHWDRPAVPPPLPAVAAEPPPIPTQPPPPVSRAPLPRVEIHPRGRRNGLLIAIGSAVFLATGVWLMQNGEEQFDALWGLGSVLFGALGLWASRRISRRKTSMVLTPERLEQVTIYGAASMPWRDVEKVGALSYLGQKMLGVRLKTYDAYLGGMSQELAGAITKAMPFVRVAASAMSLVPGSQLLTLWSRLDGVAEPAEALKDVGKVGDVAGMLVWSRKTLGYDILFGWADFDRPVAELVDLLEQYRGAAEWN
jgi:hypothetical protein